MGILGFFSHLIWVLRAIRAFRDRTIYRQIKEMPSFNSIMINDMAHFQKYESKSHFPAMFFLSKLKFNKNLSKGLRRLLKKCCFYGGN